MLPCQDSLSLVGFEEAKSCDDSSNQMLPIPREPGSRYFPSRVSDDTATSEPTPGM